MDTERAKRLIRYLTIWLLLTGITAVCCLLQLRSDYREAAEKILWLKEVNPEMEADLVTIYQGDWQEEKKKLSEKPEETGPDAIQELADKYGYTIWKSRDGKRITGMFAVLAGVSGGVFLLLYACDSHAAKKRKRSNGQTFQQAAEWADRYLRGIFSKTDMEVSSEEAEVFRDKMQQLGDYLKDFKERAAAEEADTKALITNISHQLKTPMASLRMSQELLESQELTEEEREEFLLNNRKEIEKLENLLEEMLKLSRLENHMIRLRPENASLKETLVGAVNTVYMKAFARKIEISMKMEEDFEVYQDVRWTQETFVNVLDNAVKYSPEGSEIRIRVQKMQNIALVEIEDQGIGIAPEEYHRIFKRFYRGENAVVMEKEGAGVGLYLARTILEQQGGSIRVKPRNGGGSIFQMTLALK